MASIVDSSYAFEVRYEDENIWLTQKMISTLYKINVRTINEHIKKYIQIANWLKSQLSGNTV